MLNEETCLSAARNSSFICNLSELFSLNQLICKPTRVMFSTSTLIDHISTTCIDSIIDSRVHKVTLSDLYIDSCKRKVNVGLCGYHKLIITRNMTHFNRNTFGRYFKY